MCHLSPCGNCIIHTGTCFSIDDINGNNTAATAQYSTWGTQTTTRATRSSALKCSLCSKVFYPVDPMVCRD